MLLLPVPGHLWVTPCEGYGELLQHDPLLLELLHSLEIPPCAKEVGAAYRDDVWPVPGALELGPEELAKSLTALMYAR